MAVEYFVVATFGLAIIVYLYLTWNYSYWTKRGVPQLQPLPGAGNMIDVIRLKKGIYDVESELYNKFAGHKVAGFYRFRQPVLMVRDPDVIKAVLIKDFSSFHNNCNPYNIEFDPAYSKHLFFLEGYAWKAIKGQIAKMFSPVKVKQLFPVLKDICRDLNTYIETHIDEDINVRKLSTMYALDVTSNIQFGLESKSFSVGDNSHQQLYKIAKAAERNMENQFLLLCYALFPRIAQLLKLRLFPECALNYLEMAVKQTEDYREKNNIRHDDFLQFLLSLKKKSDTSGEEFTTKDVAQQCLILLLDTIETNKVSHYALSELAKNCDIQERLRAELQSATKEGSIDYETLMNLPYLDKVVSETLRVYSGYFLYKLCTKETPLDVNGKLIPVEKGTMVLIPAYNIQHDPDYYKNPGEFDPERFSEENVASRHPNVFLSFSAGPRMCPGIRFALIQIKCFIYHTVLKYKLRSCKEDIDGGYCNPLSISIKKQYANKMWLRFEKYVH